MKFVRESSQRRLASHTHIHDPDTHGDQSRSLIIQPELTSKPYWARLKTISMKSRTDKAESAAASKKKELEFCTMADDDGCTAPRVHEPVG